MEVQNVSSASNFQSFRGIEKVKKEPKTKEETQDSKKLAFTLGALAAIGAAAVGLAVARGNVKEVEEIDGKSSEDNAVIAKGTEETAKIASKDVDAVRGNEVEETSATLSDINFDGGLVRTKEGEEFTGKIVDKLKNGDEVSMEYKDGLIQSATRKGTENYTKTYEYKDSIDGNELTSIITSKNEGRYYYSQDGKKMIEDSPVYHENGSGGGYWEFTKGKDTPTNIPISEGSSVDLNYVGINENNGARRILTSVYKDDDTVRYIESISNKATDVYDWSEPYSVMEYNMNTGETKFLWWGSSIKELEEAYIKPLILP